jgi:transketolase
MGDQIGQIVNGKLIYVPYEEFLRVRNSNLSKLNKLKLLSSLCRLNVLYMVANAGSGHIGSSFSSMEIMCLMLSEIEAVKLNGNPSPVFFSSKGHDAPALYSVMIGLGNIDFSMIHKLRRLNGLPGHPDVNTPGIVTNTGSLGMGVSKAKGMIIADRIKNISKNYYVLTGDGELQEGQFWESLISAKNFKMGELTVIIDHNKLQSDTLISKVSDLGDLEAKLFSFGWKVYRVDGNNIEALMQVIEEGKNILNQPKVIIADTIKGKGVSFMEHTSIDSDVEYYKYHSGAPNADNYNKAAIELSNASKIEYERYGLGNLVFEEVNLANNAIVAIGKQEKLVQIYSEALISNTEKNSKIVALDADLILDTGLIPYKDQFPDRLIECGIAEQDMVSMAGGLALNNFIPIVHSFACFLTSRPLEQIYNNCTENSRIIYVGSLAGIIPAGPGHSHQSVKDIALMSSLPNMTCLEPVSPIQVKESLNWALLNNGPTYLRLTSIPLNFSDSLLSINLPQLGKGNLISQGEDVLLISVGPVLSIEASIAISELVDELNYNVCHVIMPWVNNIDLCWWKELILGKSSILIYENHDLRNGFGEYFKSKIFGNIPNEIRIIIFGVSGIPVSGRNHEVLKYYQLDSNSIKNQLLSVLDA